MRIGSGHGQASSVANVVNDEWRRRASIRYARSVASVGSTRIAASHPSRIDACARIAVTRTASGSASVKSEAASATIRPSGEVPTTVPSASIARPWLSSDAGSSIHEPSARRKLRNVPTDGSNASRRKRTFCQARSDDLGPAERPAVEQVDLEGARHVVGA